MLSEETYKVKWGEDLAIAFKGLSREEGLNVFRWIGNNYVIRLSKKSSGEIADDRASSYNVYKGCFSRR